MTRDATYRLRRADSRNWSIDRQTKSGTWNGAGYYGRLNRAARRLLELTGTGDVLVGAVKGARIRIAQAASQTSKAESGAGCRDGKIGPCPAHTAAILGRYRLARDAKCWAIQTPHKRKGEEAWGSVAWLPTLDAAGQRGSAPSCLQLETPTLDAAGQSLFDMLMLELSSELPTTDELVALTDSVREMIETRVRLPRDADPNPSKDTSGPEIVASHAHTEPREDARYPPAPPMGLRA